MIQNQEQYLYELCDSMDIRLSETQLEQFMQFYRYLIEKNTVMNLTAITEYKEVAVKHFADSLSLVKAIRVPEDTSTVLDLGTGAGFPGIPLKIAYPWLKITLVDSLNKRVNFLNEVIDICRLDDIRAIHSRAEDLGKQNEHREQYDFCVSRAVANLSSLSEYCIPFVKVGGKFISYKAGDIKEELANAKKAVSILGGDIKQDVVKFCLPGSDISRTLIVIDKIKQTPKKYPRRAGIPAREPLGV